MAETVGTLVDKLSITELKIYHMNQQIHRPDVSEDHRRSCQEKVEILTEQKNDLKIELSELFKDVGEGRKKLKVYRQFKMYNDPKYRAQK